MINTNINYVSIYHAHTSQISNNKTGYKHQWSTNPEDNPPTQATTKTTHIT